MKAGIVSSGLVAKHRRLDPAYYLADTAEIDRQIKTAKQTLRKTVTRIRNLRAQRAEDLARRQALIDNGDLVLLASSGD
jgi:hypothetical protein